MINTEKGKCLFDKVKDNFNLIKSSYNDVLEDNLSFSKVVEMPKEREEIFSLLKKDQQQKALNKIKELTSKSFKQKIHDTVFIHGSKIKYRLLKK